MNAIEKRIYQLAKPYLDLAFRDNDTHTQIALDYALTLLKQIEADRNIVAPATILHDVGYSRMPEEKYNQWRSNPEDVALCKIHEQEGVKIAKGILEEVNYNASLIDEILRIISIHDTGGAPNSINEEIVRDADVLWRFSKNGFWTTLEIFDVTPEERLIFLESKIEEWLFMDISKEIARKQLSERRREAKVL